MTATITRKFLPLFAAIAAFFFVSQAEAQTTTHYTGHLGAIPVNIKIVWANYNGLGDVWGTISYAGRTLRFSGANSRPGYLWFKDSDGVSYSLNKLNTSSTIGWQGKGGGERMTLSRRR